LVDTNGMVHFFVNEKERYNNLVHMLDPSKACEKAASVVAG